MFQEKKEAVTSEQKRREQIRSGFGTLQTLLPIQTNSNTKVNSTRNFNRGYS